MGIDGEVVEFRLETLARRRQACTANRDGSDVVTADASLVIVDCLMRHGFIADGHRRLRRSRCAAPRFARTLESPRSGSKLTPP